MRVKVTIFVGFIVLFSFLAADIPEGYYDDAEGLVELPLKTVLHDIIKDHKQYGYGEVWNILRYSDQDPDNPENVIFLYTGWSKSKFNNGGGASQWNREHTWAKSHGRFGTRKGAGTDAHHLRPTDVTVNSARGNLDFDEGGEIYTDPDGPTTCRVDGDSWEPRDEVKGDVARMLFYMAVRYEGDAPGEPDLELNEKVNNGKNPFHGKLSILLKWHQEDPVSDWELRRNDRVYEKQNNRNPFIDHPEYANYIWGGGGPDPGDDVTPPGISGVTFQSTSTGAVITWTTDEPANSIVYYGKTRLLLVNAAYDETNQQQHSITLDGLEQGTTYYFNVSSTDGDGNGPTYSPVYSFDPLDPVDPPPGAGIVITEIAANPSGSYRNEFVELHNASAETIDISGWDLVIHRSGSDNIVVRLGSTGNLHGSTSIAPGAFYIVTRGTVAYADHTSYDGLYLNRRFYVELKNGGAVKDQAGAAGDRFAPNTNHELTDPAADNSKTTSWIDEGQTYEGSSGHL